MGVLAIVGLLASCAEVPPNSATASPPTMASSREANDIAWAAIALIGTPYRWGGETPESGLDCSGFVVYVMRRAIGVHLPRTTVQLSQIGQAVPLAAIDVGDLVFFNTEGRPHSHVGIYVGQGQFVDAPSSGGSVREHELSDPYWAHRLDAVRRVRSTLGPGALTSPSSSESFSSEAESATIR